jgi:hypothetical protein
MLEFSNKGSDGSGPFSSGKKGPDPSDPFLEIDSLEDALYC